MIAILIGNLCSLLGMGSDCLSSSRKNPKEVLWLQALSQFIYCIGSIVLKGYSAAVQSLVSIIRNIAATRENNPKYLEWLLVVLAVVFGIIFNNRGIYGWLPIIANFEYSIAVFAFKDNERALKIAFSFCVTLFAAFNAVLLNFVGVVTNIIVLITTISFIVKSGKKGKVKEAEKRVGEMESCFDALQADPNCEGAAKMRKALEEYYESKQWLADYELDEKGLLPKDLKRGVLSEDGLYNFLQE